MVASLILLALLVSSTLQPLATARLGAVDRLEEQQQQEEEEEERERHLEPQTVRECDAALMKKLRSVRERGHVYLQAWRLRLEIGCYQRARGYMEAISGPSSAEEFAARMGFFRNAILASSSREAFERHADMDAAKLWPYLTDEDLADHRSEIADIVNWSQEIEYVPFSQWKIYQDMMWDKFLAAFESREKKKLIVAVNVEGGGGGNTQICNSCEDCFWMFCKSTLWSLVHIWDHLFSIPKKFGFMQGVDLYFYGSGAQVVPATGAGTGTVVVHLQDASYSGDQISILTRQLKQPPGFRAVQVGLIVVGKRYSVDEHTEKAHDFAKPCSLNATRCFVFGHEAENALDPKSCTKQSHFDHGAHFLVQHKAADDISLGDCWQWYQFLGLRTPYSQDHDLLPVAPTRDSKRSLEASDTEPKRRRKA